jgi:hypothetical protein
MAMQLETRYHTGYTPDGEKVYAKILIPKKSASKQTDTIPSTIFVSEAPGIHYEKDFTPNNDLEKDIENESMESVDDSCCSYNLAYHNDSVFRPSGNELEIYETAESRSASAAIERQHAFTFSRSLESNEDIVFIPNEDDYYVHQESKSSRPRLMRGLLNFLKTKKANEEMK